jgi:hypothetical protein
LKDGWEMAPLEGCEVQLPAPIVKEALGSSEFWSNRIRKDFKGKDDAQIAFCDGLKRLIIGLVEYHSSRSITRPASPNEGSERRRGGGVRGADGGWEAATAVLKRGQVAEAVALKR